LATGKRAFEGDDRGDLIVKILDRNPPAMSEQVAMVPPAFDRVVRKCMAKDPDERWQSARDLLDELKWIDAMRASATLAPARVAAPPSPARPRRGGRGHVRGPRSRCSIFRRDCE
jgi:serine/threonine protein kinase